MTWVGLIPNAGMYGSGVDGDVTISAGTTVLSRNMHYNNLTINGSGQLDPNGFEVLVKEVLTFGSGCVIESRGDDAVADVGGAGSSAGTISGRSYGGNGDITDFTAPPGTGGSYTIGINASGGVGGAGDAGPPFSVVAYAAQTAAMGGNAIRLHQHFLMECRVYTLPVGTVDMTGSGGFGGSGDGISEPGGGGGATGGCIIVRARRIIGVGGIRSIGGNGGDGSSAGGATGGGGAGSGGPVFVFCDSIDPSVSVTSETGVPGLGQNGGSDGEVGTNGFLMVMRQGD